ncbi:MAG: DUF4199 family protein [Vicingaceae bacterium]|nr:DUF4199 family protein [Vicingaceae bacterium]
MFKNPFQVAVIFALIALIAKLTLMFLGIQHDSSQYIIYAYMLIILCAIFFGMRSNKVMYDGPTTFGQDFKTGARTASFFAILVGLITYVYYNSIDPEFLSIKKDAQIEVYKKSIKETTIKNGLNATVKSMPIEFQNKVSSIEKYFIAEAMNTIAENPKIKQAITNNGIEKTKTETINNIVIADTIYSPLSQTSYTLFGLVFLGLFHSGVFAMLMKKFPGFKK